MALAVLKHKKSTAVYFCTFQTNLDFKDKALNRLEDPQKALATRDTPFQFQYQVLVPAPMSLAWDYACNLVVDRFVDSRNWHRSRPKYHLYLVYHLVYHLLDIISPNSQAAGIVPSLSLIHI